MEDSYYGYVYLVRNMVTNRAYVGQKKGAFNKNYFGSGKLIRRALEKHGKKMFQRQVLEYCNTREELDAREIHYIAAYRELWTPGLYNITNGGSGLNGYKPTQAQIDALVKNAKENPPRKGVRLPQEQVERQRKSLKEFWKNNPEKLKAKAKLNQKRVMCKETGVIYDSLKDASGGDKSLHACICMACKGKIKTSRGLHWEYVDEKTGEQMKLQNGKWITIGITAAPKTRQLLDKICLYEHKKIKPFFEEMLVGYIQQSYNLHKEAIEGIESDIRNIKQMMDSLSLSLDCTTDKEEREMIKSRIETAEKFYGILFTRKTNHHAHAVEYQKMIEDYHRE